MFDKLRELMTSREGSYISYVLSKWYYGFMILVLGVTYKVLIALDQIGLIDKFQEIIATSFVEINRIAEECTPKIIDLKQFYDCL